MESDRGVSRNLSQNAATAGSPTSSDVDENSAVAARTSEFGEELKGLVGKPPTLANRTRSGQKQEHDSLAFRVSDESPSAHQELHHRRDHNSNSFSTNVRLSRSLRIVDGLGVTIGIMVGSGVFASPGEVVDRSGGTRLALLAWTASSVLVMLGALCYAELGAAFPHAGGDYWFLRLAYGEWAGFAFTWTNFFVLKTGSQAIILYVGSSYLIGGAEEAKGDARGNGWVISVVAVCSVWILTGLNCLGVKFGSIVQNGLTTLKMAVLVAVCIIGVVFAATRAQTGASSCAKDNLGLNAAAFEPGTDHHDFANTGMGFALAMVACLWAFDGWADVAFLGEELANPKFAMPVVVLVSVGTVAFLFILVNIAYMMVLTSDEISSSHALAIDFAQTIGGSTVAGVFAFAVFVSSVGSANGSILTGGRVFFAAARDGRFPAILATLGENSRSPYAALIAQGVVSSCLLLLPGASFASLLHYFAPASWLFYAATGSTVIVLRRKFPQVERPFHCPLYPLPPIVVIIVGLCLVVSCVASSPLFSCAALGFVFISYPVYYVVYRETVSAISGGAGSGGAGVGGGASSRGQLMSFSTDDIKGSGGSAGGQYLDPEGDYDAHSSLTRRDAEDTA